MRTPVLGCVTLIGLLASGCSDVPTESPQPVNTRIASTAEASDRLVASLPAGLLQRIQHDLPSIHKHGFLTVGWKGMGNAVDAGRAEALDERGGVVEAYANTNGTWVPTTRTDESPPRVDQRLFSGNAQLSSVPPRVTYAPFSGNLVALAAVKSGALLEGLHHYTFDEFSGGSFSFLQSAGSNSLLKSVECGPTGKERWDDRGAHKLTCNVSASGVDSLDSLISCYNDSKCLAPHKGGFWSGYVSYTTTVKYWDHVKVSVVGNLLVASSSQTTLTMSATKGAGQTRPVQGYQTAFESSADGVIWHPHSSSWSEGGNASASFSTQTGPYTFYVRATATDRFGSSATKQVAIEVGAPAPLSVVIVGPTSLSTGSGACWIASTSGGVGPFSYAWSEIPGTDSSSCASFAEPGWHYPRVTVTDQSTGQAASSAIGVWVGDAPGDWQPMRAARKP